jgi:ribose transport system substrate-binding protein
MRKSVLVLLASVLALGLLLAPAFGQAKKKVAVCLPGTVEFFSVEKKGIDRAAQKYNIDVVYADAEWDAGKQLNQVENFVAQKVDLIMLCARDPQALIPAVATCKKGNIPLITFTNTVGPNPDGKFDGVISYIGTNEINMGKLLGQMAEKLLGNKVEANIVLLEGDPGTAPQRLRTQGFKEVITKHPKWQIVYNQAIEGWKKEGALAAMESFLQTGKRVDLVTTHWYAAASASSQALEEAKYKKNKVYITGLEFGKELVPLIQSGKIDMTSNYSVEETGYMAMEAAAKYLKGEKIPAFIEPKVIIVSKDNVGSIKPEL